MLLNHCGTLALPCIAMYKPHTGKPAFQSQSAFQPVPKQLIKANLLFSRSLLSSLSRNSL